MPESQELEGKFACREEDIEQLLALTNIGDFQLTQRDERTQTDTYFDTAALDLRSQSCSLRKRSIGENVKATFKGPRQTVDNAENAAHLVKRLEIEVPVTPPPIDEQSFLERVDLEPVSRARGMLDTGKLLHPIARLITHRRMLNYVRGEGESVELSLDHVQALDLRTNRRTHIVEVELELVEGADETLVSAAESLREAIPSLRPTSESKLARTLGETPDSGSSAKHETTAR